MWIGMEAIEEIGDLLTRKKLRMAIAESCTGGAISDAFTNISGASQFFVLGIVAYSTEAKENLLGVHSETIEKYGLVSVEVAKEMCINVKKITNADIGVSTTGYASSGAGVPDEKVGVVYIGISSKTITVYENRFKGQRENVKKTITRFTAEKLLEIIKREF